jgi:hypothetical protein
MEKKSQGCLLKWRRGRGTRCSLGQSILEYAILLSVVAAALTVMAFYVKRAVQGKINLIDDQLVAKTNQSPAASGPWW